MPHNAGIKLVETIKKQLDRIDYFSSAANVSPNLAVHEMRKTFKRLRALVRFYCEFPVEFPPDYANQIKYFGRSLTTMRESFVNIQIFDRVVAENTMIPERKIKAAKEKLVEKNKIIIDKGFLEAGSYETMQNFAQLLAKHIERFEIGLPSLNQIVKQLEISNLEAFQIFRQTHADPDPEIMHELRKKMKRLMYQYDFIRYLHPRFFKLKTFQLNNITEQLGEDHDLYIFVVDLKNGGYGFTPGEFEIIENRVEHLCDVNQVKLLPRLKHFFSDPPEALNQKLEILFKIPVV